MTSTGNFFQASSSDVSDFTDVALSFINTLTEHSDILKSETVGGQHVAGTEDHLFLWK